MPEIRCLECGRQLPKRHTRCLPCDDLRYQAELESPAVVPPSNVGFTQNLAEISGNRKAQKADLKKAQLDSAYAWGTAIGEQEEDYSNQFLPDSFCSGCGVKLSLSSNFCNSTTLAIIHYYHILFLT